MGRKIKENNGGEGCIRRADALCERMVDFWYICGVMGMADWDNSLLLTVSLLMFFTLKHLPDMAGVLVGRAPDSMSGA